MALYIVSTPIGNLGDTTARAVECLAAAHRILAEDTRRTKILLRHHRIDTPLVSLHEHNEAARTEQVLAWLDDGENLALVSDAGTPLLSDPGERLVRAAIDHGVDVIPIPGASALLAALVVAGLPTTPFTFFGFLPRAARARRDTLDAVAACRHTAILYEAPGRLSKLLASLLERCEPSRRVAVARELTKVHESVVRGTLEETAAYYENTEARGEVVVVLAGASVPAPGPGQVERLARSLLESGGKRSAVARELTRQLGVSREEAYRIALAAKRERRGEAD